MTTTITPAPAHQKPSGKLYLSVNQLNLVDGTWTKVLLDTIEAGFVDGIEDTVNHRITPGQAGFYNVTGMVTFTNVVTPHMYRAALFVSGAAWRSVNMGEASVGLSFSLLVGDLLKLSATDYIELYARSYSGDNTVDILSDDNHTFLSVQRVR